jgi:hypothetical protein
VSRAFLFALITVVLGLGLAGRTMARAAEPQWWKGNLHTHTLWSDGDEFPEIVVEWYKTNGYHFLGLSDHNTMQQGIEWLSVRGLKRQGTLDAYLKRFGPKGVSLRHENGVQYVRLKTLSEFRGMFEEPNRFLLIPAEEITDNALLGTNKIPVHINANNVRYLIKPAGGVSVLDVIQRNVNAVLMQARLTGQPMFPHINHPNFGWAMTVEDLMRVEGERFFEVYNGHPQVRNEGNAEHPDTDRMWDIALTFRLTGLRLGPLYALAVDDAHHYRTFARTNANPGRGWVMVNAPRLRPEDIVHAMELGDFYASSGVKLREVHRAGKRLSVVIDGAPGVEYVTQFIGTRRGFDPTTTPVPPLTPGGRGLSHRYSADVGAVLAEERGLTPAYTLRGDEIYVRAKIVSSRRKENPYAEGELEAAWTQPLVAEAPRR